MDKMNWPWKKKSSDKQAADGTNASAAVSDIDATQVNKGKQDNSVKTTKYVQISIESHEHLTGLEDQLKSCEARGLTLEDEVKELKEKLSVAHSDITEKENLVKQHAKVAEEAVSGWEKADAEAATLKHHLESVTLLKINEENRASHLDDALKECMKQIRNLKEEHSQELNAVVLEKKMLFDEMKQELDAKIANMNQQILRSTADNDALSRSLQERSNMLIKLGQEKSQAEAEISLLKRNIESCEKEVSSLKYELHIARKEVEIRNEEKNMSVRSAEVATKQHLEGVKKVAKLEAECQRLRSLVRKKLPGPAALAQMKVEVESLGRDYGDSRSRRSPRKPSFAHMSQSPDFSMDIAQKYHKESELLVERLLAMDEETRILKETLSQCNSELHASRSSCEEMASKLRTLEAQQQAGSEQGSPLTFNTQKVTNLRRTAVIEDGNDDSFSCAGSLATVSMSEFSYIREKNGDSPHESRNSNHMDLMDDFLEMEKLAYESNDSQSRVSCSDVSVDAVNKGSELARPETTLEVALNPQPGDNCRDLDLVKLRSKIHTVLESIRDDKDTDRMIDHVKLLMQDMLDALPRQSLNGDAYSVIVIEKMNKQELDAAISHIHDFVIKLSKEAKAVQRTSGNGLNESLATLSSKYGDAYSNEIDLTNFIVDISNVLRRASEMLHSEVELNSSYCIDKIALSVNKAVEGSLLLNGCVQFSDSSSDSIATSWKCSSEEIEQLKRERDGLAADLETTKSRLAETEQVLADVKLQLASDQRSNSLAETQLKCMAESYKTLESQAEELRNEINLLRGTIEALDDELHEEKRSHRNAVARCNDLQEQLQRMASCAAADNDKNTSQDELATAAEKLAECQETIQLLGKQLKTLRPQTDSLSSPSNAGGQKLETSTGEAETERGMAVEANHRVRSPFRSKHRNNHRGCSSSGCSTPEKKQSRGFIRFFSSSKGKVAN
ncbi:filament-like plant protein 4 [Andrographis paniculata]|uniref:filament-like plant protein 4 n=1 Tax=Andrographis paniculata TaxID=175694 RepID=UPI0021E7B1C8|nr:filament-like plant protein 4 [Andrographis paniculata]XP_051150101.1 filament-like plant protein 4 [Andrographis paniculata]XP_051150102.1 filament-like plant protein 4 [Andrographis paniculata]